MSDSDSNPDPAAWSRLAEHAQAAAAAIGEAPAQEPDQPGAFTRLIRDLITKRRAAWHTLWHPLDTFRAWLARVLAPPTAPRGLPIVHSTMTVQDTERTSQARAQAVEKEPAVGRSAAGEVRPSEAPSIDDTWQTVRAALLAAAQDPTADPKAVGSRIAEMVPPTHRTAVAERLTVLAETARATAQALQERETKTPEPVPVQDAGEQEKAQESKQAPEAAQETAPAAPETTTPSRRRRPKAPVPETPTPPAPMSVPSRSAKRAARGR